jgi:multidrug efflux pump subunit AcrA (membrane-fusion protein)
LGWGAQLEAAKKEIAELESRISALREELRVAQRATDSARVQRILAIREQQLERAKFLARSIEPKVAEGRREAIPMPYFALASLCFLYAGRGSTQGGTAEALKTLGKTFAAKAGIANRGPRPAAPGPAGREPTQHTRPVSSPATLSGQKRAAI